MAELLKHQSSMAYYDRNRSGCMWGLFKFLHMHKHLHRRKRLSYRDGKNKVGAELLRLERNDTSAENEPLLDKIAVMQMENKVCTKKRSSGAAHLINFLYKKMIKKKDHKLKVSTSASRLIRTLSMHHLECNDYLLPSNSFSGIDPSPFDLNSNELALPENENIAQSPKHIKGPAFDKQQIKEAIKENIKMEHLITLDGVLDKIPIDQKMNGKMQGDKRSKFGSEGYVNINSRLAKRTIQRSLSLTESLERYSNELEEHTSFLRSNSVNNKDNTFTDRRTLRSHSLNESFEIYSRLPESVSVRHNQQHYQRLSSVREHDDTYEHRRTSSSRSLSGSLDVYARILESVSNIEYRKHPERLRSVKDDVNSHSELRLSSLDNDASDEFLLQSIEKHEQDLPIIDNTKPVGLFSNVEAKDSGERTVDQTEIYGSPNQSELINEHNQCEKIVFETGIKEGLDDISPKPTPVSVLDSIVDEDPVSPIYTCNEDAKPQPWIRIEERDGSKSVEPTDTAYGYDNNDQNLTIEDLEFNYVKTVLMKSRFCEGLDEFLSAWYSSYEPGDQLLFVDEENIKDEMFYDMGLDHRLFLLDLINEILMEFYERSVASITGLTRYSSCVKPLFVGDHLIQEVWEKVNWHLSTRNDICDVALEWEESRFFTKRDGWINLLFDVEGVGVEMESLILDELIDELVDDCFRN